MGLPCHSGQNVFRLIASAGELTGRGCFCVREGWNNDEEHAWHRAVVQLAGERIAYLPWN